MAPVFEVKETPVPPKLYRNPKVELKPLVSALVEILTDFLSVLLEKRSWLPAIGFVLAIFLPNADG